MLSVIASSLYCSYFVKRPTMMYKKKKGRNRPTLALTASSLSITGLHLSISKV